MAVTNNSEMLRAVNAYYGRRLSRQALSFVVKSYSGTAVLSDTVSMPQSAFAEIIDFVNEGLPKIARGTDHPCASIEVDSVTERIRIVPVGSANQCCGPTTIQAESPYSQIQRSLTKPFC